MSERNKNVKNKAEENENDETWQKKMLLLAMVAILALISLQ
jgi:hypothetical protein